MTTYRHVSDQSWHIDLSDSCAAIAAASEMEKATKDDILKITNAILKLRDERIVQLEQQLTKIADDSRKLRTELWPLFKLVKEREPLPYRPQDGNMGSPDYMQTETLISPQLPSGEPEKKISLTRTFSKKLGLSSATPKNHSPTHFPSTIPEGKSTHDAERERILQGLQPSAAAAAASSQLTAGMSGGQSLSHHSPNPNSPTSPMPALQHQPMTGRSFSREHNTSYNRYDGFEDTSSYRNPIPTPPLTGIVPDPISNRSATTIGNKSSTMSNTSTLIPSREMSASVPPQSSAGGGRSKESKENKDTSADAEDPSVQIFKSFRVALDDPCWKVLPAALRKYNIQADWRQYALYIVYGDQERCVGLEEKPLALFKDLDREGKKPMFMLRKLANGIVSDVPGGGGSSAMGGIRPGTAGAGIQSSNASIRTAGQGAILPGGII